MFKTYGPVAGDDRLRSYANRTCWIPEAEFERAVDAAIEEEESNFAPSPGAILAQARLMAPLDYDPVTGTRRLRPAWERAMLAHRSQEEMPRQIGGRTGCTLEIATAVPREISVGASNEAGEK